ncbi:MAG TPA: zf-HC2 domain-containing protein [Gemmatimonas sp.]|uniref:zf-HC2 domain-containing protein n=1 Tax=Gemmatimonas sp. TaxID=1962908 RepID=UPI002EDB94AC
MDCKQFRKQHLAYLDNTLSGEATSAAQRHVMACDPCAAHDTMVRRSLMVARSLPSLSPSDEFQARLRERLATCRSADGRYPAGDELGLPRPRATKALIAVAASAVLGVIAIQSFQGDRPSELSMQPVIASQPSRPVPLSAVLPAHHDALNGAPTYVTPALVQVMATGNPVWPAAMIVEDAPMQLVSAHFSFEVR